MAKEAAFRPLNFENVRKGERSELLDNGSQRGPYLGLDWIHENLRQIMADYISDDNSDLTRRALLGKQPITLCLSHFANLDLDSCWNFGCLSPEDGWESSIKVKVDKQYPIEDCQSYLKLLCRENTLYCPIAIEVLIFQFDASLRDFARTLDELQETLAGLQGHLNGVKHVIFVVEKYAFCCFTFKDFINSETGRRHTDDRSLAMERILADIRTCWTLNHNTLSTKLLLDYYIMSDVKPESEVYLSKLVIAINHAHNGDLFESVDTALKYDKLRWLYSLKTVEEVINFDQRIACRCHAIHLDAFKLEKPTYFNNRLPSVYCIEDIPFVERIVIKFIECGILLKLPRPSQTLTDITLHSALVELTLTGDNNTVYLEHLNNGYFKNLTHLSIVGGHITGQLDSRYLPSLKTLILTLGNRNARGKFKMTSLVHEPAQSLIRAGRPWQLVATKETGGWSLASYDDPISNPHDEVKEDSPPSSPHLLPLIKELLLVANHKTNADELQLQLNGDLPLKMDIEDCSSRQLVWAPERVQKITAICCSLARGVKFEFNKTIQGQVRILNSLRCCNVYALVNGVALPQLQSLEIVGGWVGLSGAFLELQKLSIRGSCLESPWKLDAPLLQSLHCHQLICENTLSLHPQLLPHLSSLYVEPWPFYPAQCPIVLDNASGLGLSRVKDVFFGNKMTLFPCFDQCQVHNILHLELAVNVLKLPACWSNTEWQCETLKLNIYVDDRERCDAQEITVVLVLPSLPRVKKLTVTKEYGGLCLDREMLELTECTVTSPRVLGPNLKCPLLKRIRFTEKLSKSDREKYSNPATYEAFGARPT